MRPQSLHEVVERTRTDPEGDWDHHLREFLDAFYGADGDTRRQAGFVAEDPGFLGKDRADAFLGGVGEHLARRWRLPAIPSWVRDGRRYLDRPFFVPGDRALRGYLICVSPVAFRARLIFTGPDPLQRARFPYHRGTIAMPPVFPVPRQETDGEEAAIPASDEPDSSLAARASARRRSCAGRDDPDHGSGSSHSGISSGTAT